MTFGGTGLPRRRRTSAMSANGWLHRRPADTSPTKTRPKFSLNEEQAFTLANEDSPAYLPGAFELALGSLAAVPRIAESFRTGAGMGWHEHADGVFHGCEKFFRPGLCRQSGQFVDSRAGWSEAKLEAGARVADVGCGKGASTILMAQAFPSRSFYRLRLSR